MIPEINKLKCFITNKKLFFVPKIVKINVNIFYIRKISFLQFLLYNYNCSINALKETNLNIFVTDLVYKI